MKNSIKKVHNINPKIFSYSGPLLLADFLNKYKDYINNAYEKENIEEKKSEDTIFIGFPGTRNDKELFTEELNIIDKFNSIITNSKLNRKILYKPYPTMSKSDYDFLYKLKNVEVFEKKYSRVKRYTHGKEYISFDNATQRISFFKKCSYIVSLASTITFEGLITKTPIIQFYLDKYNRKDNFSKKIFERIDMGDHIKDYMLNDLILVKSYEEIVAFPIEEKKFSDQCLKKAEKLSLSIGLDKLIIN